MFSAKETALGKAISGICNFCGAKIKNCNSFSELPLEIAVAQYAETNSTDYEEFEPLIEFEVEKSI